MIGSILAAEFTKGGSGRPSILDINKIVDGYRTNIISFKVATKREAREVAKQYGARCWNF